MSFGVLFPAASQTEYYEIFVNTTSCSLTNESMRMQNKYITTSDVMYFKVLLLCIKKDV